MLIICNSNVHIDIRAYLDTYFFHIFADYISLIFKVITFLLLHQINKKNAHRDSLSRKLQSVILMVLCFMSYIKQEKNVLQMILLDGYFTAYDVGYIF